MNLKKVVNNSFFIMTARGMEMASGLVISGILARYLGVSEFGEYSFFIAISLVLLPVFNLGFPRLLVVKISGDRGGAQRYLGAGLVWNSLMLLTILCAIPAIGFFINDKSAYTLLFCVLFMGFMSLGQTIGSVLIAYELMKYETYASLVSMIALFVFTAAVVYFDLGLVYIFAAMAAAYLLSLIALCVFTYRTGGFMPRLWFDRENIKYLWGESFYLALYQVSMQVFLYTGVFVLKSMSDNAAVALFLAPMRVFTRLTIIPLSLMASLLPVFSKISTSAAESNPELVNTTQATYKFLLIISIAFTILGLNLADEAINLIYGASFADAVTGFRILILSTAFFFINVFFSNLFMARSENRKLFIIQLSTVAICLMLNISLIKFGHIGSSIAISVSSGAFFLAGCYLHMNLLKKDFLARMLGIKALGLISISMVLLSGSFGYIVSAAASMIFFFGGMFLFKFLAPVDIDPFIRMIWLKKAKGEKA